MYNSSYEIITSIKVNAILLNIANISREDNESEEEEMQSLSLPQGQEIDIEIESPKIDITPADMKDDRTVKEIFGVQDINHD